MATRSAAAGSAVAALAAEGRSGSEGVGASPATPTPGTPAPGTRAAPASGTVPSGTRGGAGAPPAEGAGVPADPGSSGTSRSHRSAPTKPVESSEPCLAPMAGAALGPDIGPPPLDRPEPGAAACLVARLEAGDRPCAGTPSGAVAWSKRSPVPGAAAWSERSAVPGPAVAWDPATSPGRAGAFSSPVITTVAANRPLPRRPATAHHLCAVPSGRSMREQGTSPSPDPTEPTCHERPDCRRTLPST